MFGLELLFYGIVGLVLIIVIIKRVRDAQKETFEKRKN